MLSGYIFKKFNFHIEHLSLYVIQMIHISERSLEIQELSLKNSNNFSRVEKSSYSKQPHVKTLCYFSIEWK